MEVQFFLGIAVDTSTLMPLAGGTFSGDVTFDGATAGYDIVWDKSDNALEWADNAKAKFGTGGDLEIFHNASNSVINDAGTGDLLLQVGGTTQATISSTGVVIANNLTVSGTTTTINTQTLDVEDKNIVVGKVSSPSDTTADGGGITLKGASDKTFNWVNATDAWTSSEHIHLLDNKKLFVGGASGTTDGLEIVHNGSNSILNDTGTGTLQLQLGGSTKLEVTSGGINVTGAITVGGSALASANTFTAVASGSIANNKAVKIDTTNGKVSEVKANVTARGAVNVPGSVNNVNSGQDNEYMKSVRCGDGLVLMIYQDTDNNHGAAIVAEHTASSGNTLAFGSEATFFQSDLIDEGIDACYIGSNKVFIAWFGTGSKVNMVIATVNPSTRAITFGSIVTTGSNTNWPAVSYDEDQDKVLLVHSTTNTTVPKGIVCSVSGTTITQGTPVSLPTVPGAGNQTTRYTTSCYDTNVNKHIIGMRKETNDRCGVLSATISGTSVSFGAWVNVNNATCFADTMEIAFNTQRNAFVILYRISNNATASSGTCAANGTITIHSTIGVMYHGNTSNKRYPGLVYDSAAQRLVAIQLNNTSHVKTRMVIMASDYTLTVPGIETTFRGAESNYISIGVSGRATTGGVVCIGSRWDQGGNNRALWAVSGETTESVTNLTQARHYVGFADQAYTDGQTVTVKTYGNNVDTLSGLTIGSVYYVDGSGNVSSNNSGAITEVGMAISADTILIKQPY